MTTERFIGDAGRRTAIGVVFTLGIFWVVPAALWARVVIHPKAHFSFWCPDDWFAECRGLDEHTEFAWCSCSTISREEAERRTGPGPRVPLPDVPSIVVVVHLRATTRSCDELDADVAERMGLAETGRRVIGGREVSTSRLYTDALFPPTVDETACFEERGYVVNIGWGIDAEPSPRLREYRPIWEKAVASFRWLETPELPAPTP